MNGEAKDDITKNIITKKQIGPHLFLNVNFDPGLLRLFKEVKYLQILNMEIPEETKAAYEKNAFFRKQISNLKNIKVQYNNIILQLNGAERPN